MRIVIRDKKTLKALAEALTITYDGNNVVVSGSQRPNRKTTHSPTKNFSVVVKQLDIKIHFTTEAIDTWIQLGCKPSLFHVQNSVNLLKAMSMDITPANVKKML